MLIPFKSLTVALKNHSCAPPSIAGIPFTNQRQARVKQPRGTKNSHLPLLPSGPDGVGHGSIARDSTVITLRQPIPSAGKTSKWVFSPAYADFGLQGTASSPPSTAFLPYYQENVLTTGKYTLRPQLHSIQHSKFKIQNF